MDRLLEILGTIYSEELILTYMSVINIYSVLGETHKNNQRLHNDTVIIGHYVYFQIMLWHFSLLNQNNMCGFIYVSVKARTLL